jgi:hypothetical protein
MSRCNLSLPAFHTTHNAPVIHSLLNFTHTSLLKIKHCSLRTLLALLLLLCQRPQIWGVTMYLLCCAYPAMASGTIAHPNACV